jgi:hypothetical protein
MTLFDHLVGATGHRQRYGGAELFGGLEIDDQLHFCCTLNRQIGRFFAIENSAGIVAGLAISVRNVRSIGYQTARQDEGLVPGAKAARAVIRTVSVTKSTN